MNTPVLQWIRKHAKNIIKNTVRPHITAIWTPLTRKRGCGRVVRHRRPGKGQPKSRVGSNPTRGAFSETKAQIAPRSRLGGAIVVLFFEKAPRVGFEPTRDFGCPFRAFGA